MSDPTLIAAGGKRSRRSWSDEEKRRIVAEAVLPGASVADIARRHGVNANLVFNWRKTARAVLSVAEPNASPVALRRLTANTWKYCPTSRPQSTVVASAVGGHRQ
jgi:transposase